MKPGFALSLSVDGISLLLRAAGGWRSVGSVALDVSDLPAALETLRARALAFKPGGLYSKLIIPNDQIRYLSIETGDIGLSARRELARKALDGATPYKVDELAFDICAEGVMTHVAAVALDTLDEAESFAVEHRFNPVSFVAVPGDNAFLGEPFFGATAYAGAALGEDEVDPDGVAVVVIGPAEGVPEAKPEARPAAKTGAKTEPKSGPKPEPKPEPKPAAAPGPKPESKADPRPETEPQTGVDGAAEAPPDVPEAGLSAPKAAPQSSGAGDPAPSDPVASTERPAVEFASRRTKDGPAALPEGAARQPQTPAATRSAGAALKALPPAPPEEGAEHGQRLRGLLQEWGAQRVRGHRRPKPGRNRVRPRSGQNPRRSPFQSRRRRSRRTEIRARKPIR